MPNWLCHFERRMSGDKRQNGYVKWTRRKLSLIIMKCFCFVFPKKPTDFLILRYFISSFFPLHFILYRVSRQYYWHLLFSFLLYDSSKDFFYILFFTSPLAYVVSFLSILYTFFFLHACYSRLSVNILFISFPLCIVCLFDVEILVVRQSLNNIKYVWNAIRWFFLIASLTLIRLNNYRVLIHVM